MAAKRTGYFLIQVHFHDLVSCRARSAGRVKVPKPIRVVDELRQNRYRVGIIIKGCTSLGRRVRVRKIRNTPATRENKSAAVRWGFKNIRESKPRGVAVVDDNGDVGMDG